MKTTTKIPLKYLFYVTYKDGKGFAQSSEDVSATDLKRSAFFDVNLDEVESFELYDPRDNINCVKVNLQTGLFIFGGNMRVEMGNNPGPKPYKLIFYRQHTHNFNIGLDELSHEVKYCIGYTDADGVEHKMFIE